jgi:hypothetical protein
MRRRTPRRLTVTLLACVGLIALTASPAAATWAGHCSDGNHCYAISDWTMTGTEGVVGAENYVWDYSMYVPPGGLFVDDEMWLTWHSKPGWVETGEEAESGGCGCTLYPFFAQNTNKNHYAEYVSPASITGPTNNGYRILSNSSHNGAWEIYWELPNGTGYKYINSVTGEYSWYSTELQGGMEAATSATPTNWESNQVRAEYFEGTWHPWVGAYTEAREIAEAGTCIRNDGNGIGSTYNGTSCG